MNNANVSATAEMYGVNRAHMVSPYSRNSEPGTQNPGALAGLV